jgi:uncharacterized membrane protein YgdD (TMEM256/DUF423 family)
MARLFFFLGSVFAGLAVVMGAWGAHSDMFDEVQMLWIDKGVRYQMFHGLALLCTSLLIGTHKKLPKLAVAAGCCFIGGIVLFCGSLFCMAVSSTDLGLVTPAGGILFLIGWSLLAVSAPGGK